MDAHTNTPVDPGGLLEYSVVFTDRSLNHMSQAFQGVMRDIHAGLTEVYNAETAVIVPGGGSIGIEAVARQFATGKSALVVRTGWFSYRWSQVFEAGGVPKTTRVILGEKTGEATDAPFAPPPIETVIAAIEADKPDVVCAAHVETSAGMILPDSYIKAMADAVHAHGGLMILDCVASGCVWVDMKATGADVLISAPQKGWSSTPCAGLIMLSARGVEMLGETKSSSFALDLAKWHQIMQAYTGGGHAYHATMPTDALRQFRDAMEETRAFGFASAADAQWQLGDRVRGLLEQQGFRSVAADGFRAPGVVVSYTDDPSKKSGAAFAAEGMQIAAGVPLEVGEGPDFSTFRIGLFGLDKLQNIERTVARLDDVLGRVQKAA
ncbi:MAG: aminotransferase class V-fold PLP-dependent enzyme [Pseudomonadota bacterium]